jgi:hypothetical protein
VVVDLATGSVVTDFTAGTGTASGVDAVEDRTIRLDGTVTVPREPDAVGWLDDRHIATANEGDLPGSCRTWTVFDTRDGSVVCSPAVSWISWRRATASTPRAGPGTPARHCHPSTGAKTAPII